jgi:hypothetical protein
MRPTNPLAVLFVTAAIISSMPHAGTTATTASSHFSCKIFFDEEALGYARYEHFPGGQGKSFIVWVRANNESSRKEATPADPLPEPAPSMPMFEAGDRLPVFVAEAPVRGSAWRYKAGTIVLRRANTSLGREALMGQLVFKKEGGISTFPAGFPSLSAGTMVSVDGQYCSLKERIAPAVPPGRG